MAEHQLIRISSRDRTTSSTSTSDFVVQLGNTGIQNASSLVVKQVTFTNVMYNINSDNNSFVYKIGAALQTPITVPVGQYTSVAAFIAAFDTAAAALGMATTFDSLTSKLSFTTTTAIEWLDIDDNPLAEVLGILKDGGSGSDVSSFAATGIVSLEGERNLYINSLELAQSNLMKSDEKVQNTLVCVPIDVGYGKIQHYVTNHASIDDVDSPSSIQGNNIQSVSIIVRDSNGNVVDFHGHHITIILKAYY